MGSLRVRSEVRGEEGLPPDRHQVQRQRRWGLMPGPNLRQVERRVCSIMRSQFFLQVLHAWANFKQRLLQGQMRALQPRETQQQLGNRVLLLQEERLDRAVSAARTKRSAKAHSQGALKSNAVPAFGTDKIKSALML